MTETTLVNKSPVPRKLNQGMIDALSLAVSKGNYAHHACYLCGISERVLYNWTELGQKDEQNDVESVYCQLVQSLKKAKAQAQEKMIQVVRDSATEDKNWLAAMTWLERTDPDNWGRKDRTRVDINEKKTITITHVEIVLNQGEGMPQVIEGESRELKEGKDATE